MKLRLLAIAASAATLAATVAAFSGNAQAATLFSDNFEDGNSTGWTTSGGTWTVAADGSQVLRQAGTSSDARARAGSTAWTDYTVTAKVRPTAFSGSNRFAAVLARAQSATSYYYVALRSNNTVELKKLVNGTATTLATTSVTVSAGSTYTVSLQVAGSALRSTVNGGAALTATDTTFTAGGVGVATFYTAANFDDVSVDTATTPTTPPPTSQTPTTPPPTTSPPVPTDGPIGFASLNTLGQNGVTGGAGGAPSPRPTRPTSWSTSTAPRR